MMMATPLKYSFLQNDGQCVKSLTHCGWESLNSTLKMKRHGREGSRENSQADDNSLYGEPGMVRGLVIARCLSMAMATSM